jgi:DNA-binding phage protein
MNENHAEAKDRWRVANEDWMADVDVVLEAPNTILEASRRLLASSAGAVNSISQNVTVAGLSRDTIYRCIAVRAMESFTTLLVLAESRGHHARLCLRPLIEDHIFLGWLRTLAEPAAEAFLRLRAICDVAHACEVQRDFLPKAYAVLGVDPVPPGAPGLSIDHMDKVRTTAEAELRQIAKRHGWGRRGPTVKAMAEATDRLDEYNFFYLASSRPVHSNLHEMGRMVWGDARTGLMSISSDPLASRHGHLAITYGCWIYSELMHELATCFSEIAEVVDSERWSVWLALVLTGVARNGMLPPLVWERELEWRSNWPRAPSQSS